ncbi:MAG: hypothetical protein ACT4OO_14210 [Nitrospiraceae bacterium]
MTCPRCHGLMTAITMMEAASGETVSGWQCLMCGEVVDSIIEANRKGHRVPLPNRARLPIASY